VRTKRRLQAMLDEMQPASDAWILELGCGTGELSAMLAERTKTRIIGADLCLPFVQAAQAAYNLPNLEFKVMDLLNQDWPAQLGMTFDFVVGNGIFHHLYDALPEVLNQIRKILKPGGKLVFWEPNYFNPYIFLIFTFPGLRQWARLEPGEKAFTRSGLQKILRNAGFESIRINYRDFLTPNASALLIRTIIGAGWVLERIPFVKNLAQSVFVAASNRGD
jgi:SAM-dependent methyltransferase